MNATAFAPGNVSGVFKIIRDDDPRRMHSLGMGFTVLHGVTAAVEEAPTVEVEFNGEAFEFATVRHVVKALSTRPVRVTLESELPLSGGFGLSGACALATAYALDAGFELGLDDRTLGMAAHVAEVTNLTGLGDVCGQFHGGCLAKLVPGDPALRGAPAGRRAGSVLPVLQPDPDPRHHRRPRAGGPNQRRGRRGDPRH